MINRRDFLKGSLAGLGAMTGLATSFASFNAFAAETNDYKALVCVFLSGGMDGHDMLIPYDPSSYNSYEAIRERLLSKYDSSSEGFSPRRRENLLPLNGDFDGRNFAFPQEMGALQELYNQGDVAVIGNVGPLIEPLTRTTYLNGSARIPPRLGSHNDSQSIWMASQPEGAASGWGGRFSDIMQAASANTNGTFSSVSAAGRSIFSTGNNIQAFEVDSSGGLSVKHLDTDEFFGSSIFAENYEAILRDAGQVDDDLSLFGKDIADTMGNAIDANQLLTEQLASSHSITTAFPSSDLGQQLEVVARMIACNEGLGAKRQVFFVKADGFDTHRNQAINLPGKQLDVATSMQAFHSAMQELGLNNNVTSFTASDFGRTLSVSRSGTDHGWGNHHLVMGGAVNGGQILGDVPLPAFGHDYDMGRGRLIPKVSVDQYAAALGGWYGLDNSEILEVLPGYSNFDASTLQNLFA